MQPAVGSEEAANSRETGNVPEEQLDSTSNESVIDVSPTGCSVSSLVSRKSIRTVARELYMYDNLFDVLPNELKLFSKLKHIKLFSNEFRYFPNELLDDLPELEQLQISVSPMGLSSFLPIGSKTSSLKTLELHQQPLKPSASALSDSIAKLQELQRLSICHFSISFVPPEIGCLHNLLELDLSFNKLKFLPKEISGLTSLKKLKLANNKLVALPRDISTLSALTSIDVSYNKLTSLSTLELHSMPSLQELNAQYNRLQETGEIPEWLVCNFEGNDWLQVNKEKNATDQKAVKRLKYKSRKLVEIHSEDMVSEKSDSELQSESAGLEIQSLETGKRLLKRESVDIPKPSKRPRAENFSEVSYKYRRDSYCGFNDYLPDGFYDAGRNRPFLPLNVLESEQFTLDAREVLLLDSTKDEDLSMLISSAQNDIRNKGDLAYEWLALFVSDSLGGSDKTLEVKRLRRSTLGTTRSTPYVCSCSSRRTSTGPDAASSFSALPNMTNLSDEAIRLLKLVNKSNVVPLGSLAYGVCRHRAILYKYLCDRMYPNIPCELIRGYFDYMPHAWNVVLVSEKGVNVRKVVDPCRPLDSRPETDPEYFCRYIPMRRMHLRPNEVELGSEAFVPLFYEEIGSGASGALVRKCSLGGHIAAAKVRNLDREIGQGLEASEKGWLSELRIYCSIGEHPNVVSFYGHQLCLDSFPLDSDSKNVAAPQLVIFMEYIKGGSLEELIKRLKKDGCIYTPPYLAVHIAESVTKGLAWLHSRGIIHRDIKSSNVLVDVELDNSQQPVVKICDFDSAVPVGSSSMHSCYLAHHGKPLTDVCVGTPRWIAPEVLDAMYTRQQYGLEADIWSFGCLLLELLTLEVPYVGISDSEIHNFIKAGQRPGLTWELEELHGVSKHDKERLEVLHRLYESCTELDPAKRPKAQQALNILSSLQTLDDSAE